MKIAPVGALPQPAPGATPSPGDGLLVGLQWRRALEQAQWELDGRFRPAGGNAGHPNREVAFAWGRSRAPAVSAEAAPGTADTGTAREPGADLAPSSADSVPAPVSGAGPAQASHPDLPSSTMNPALAATIRGKSALEAAVERCVQSCTRFADTKWSPVSVQVWLEGRKLSVTMRDARIPEREEAEIHRRLSERLAAMGLELHELIINGHPVSPAPAG